ncbi:hypothetical protein GCM10023163_29070 [Aestuariibaculum suncheonense]
MQNKNASFNVTTYSKHNYPVTPNLLNQNFEVSRQNQVWVTAYYLYQKPNKAGYILLILSICLIVKFGWL